MTMKNSNKDTRPLSPHLQIYAWNISSFTSILHRFTGVILYLAIVAISWYVVLYTYQAAPTETMPAEVCDCPGRQILQYVICAVAIGVIFCLYYHFCNGIRHLFWDIGKGFELRTAQRNGYLVIITAVILTILTAGFAAYFKFM